MPNFTNTLDITGLPLQRARPSPGLFWYPDSDLVYVPKPFRGYCPLEAFQVILSKSDRADWSALHTLHSLSAVCRDYSQRVTWMLRMVASKYHFVLYDRCIRCAICDSTVFGRSSLRLCASCEGGTCAECAVVSGRFDMPKGGRDVFCLCYECVEDVQSWSEFSHIARSLRERSLRRMPLLRHTIHRQLLRVLEEIYEQSAFLIDVHLVDFAGRTFHSSDPSVNVFTTRWPRVGKLLDKVRCLVGDNSHLFPLDPVLLSTYRPHPVSFHDLYHFNQISTRSQAVLHTDLYGHGAPMLIKVVCPIEL